VAAVSPVVSRGGRLDKKKLLAEGPADPTRIDARSGAPSEVLLVGSVR